MGSPSKRTKKSWLKTVHKIRPDYASEAVEVFSGKIHQGWTNRLTVSSIVFGALFVVAMAFGYIIFPGAIFIVFVLRELKPPRVVALSGTALTAYSQGLITRRPKNIMGVVPVFPVPPGNGGEMKLAIGDEVIHFDSSEHQRLVTSAAAMCAAAAEPDVPNFPPAPGLVANRPF